MSSLQEIVSELLPEAAGEDSAEAREKLHVIGSKLRLLSRQVEQDLQMIQERLVRVFFKVFLRHLQHRVKKRRLIPLRTHCIFFFFTYFYYLIGKKKMLYIVSNATH